MNEKEFKKEVLRITGNDSESIDRRIEITLQFLEDAEPPTEQTGVEWEIYTLRTLIDMVNATSTPDDYADEMLQLCAFMFEILDDNDNYQPMDLYASEVLKVLRGRMAEWGTIEETLPDIMDALGDSVYNHKLYEMILLYLDSAFRARKLDSDKKGWIRKLLKLKILLDDRCWCDYMLNDTLFKSISRLMDSDELLKIILHPEIEGRKKDPVEYSREWEEIYYEMEAKLNRRFENIPKGHGFCFKYWNVKKQILKDDYDIDWKTPSQMNPRIKFD